MAVPWSKSISRDHLQEPFESHDESKSVGDWNVDDPCNHYDDNYAGAGDSHNCHR